MLTNEEQEAVERLRNVIGLNTLTAETAHDIATILVALESEAARADRAEAVLRVYADGKNWKSPKGSMALILWRPNQDFASTNLGYALARKALEDKQND